MSSKKRVMAVIPARAGSKRLPDKNVTHVAGTPLVAWSIRTAQACESIDVVLVTTDDHRVIEIAQSLGAEVRVRPADLCHDDTPSLPVIFDALDYVNDEVTTVLLLQPTSPFRRLADLDAATAVLNSGSADGVIAVSKCKLGTDWMLPIAGGHLKMPGATEQSRSRVQDQTERFTPNGNFYAFRTACMSRSLMYPPGCRIAPHEVPQPYSLDIDSCDDLKMAEAVAIGWQLAPELIPSGGRRRASL